jgi:hypothetical protein
MLKFKYQPHCLKVNVTDFTASKEIRSLLFLDVMQHWLLVKLLMFQDSLPILSSRVKQYKKKPSWTAWHLKMWPTGCPEMSVTNYQLLLHNIPGRLKTSTTPWQKPITSQHKDFYVQHNYRHVCSCIIRISSFKLHRYTLHNNLPYNVHCKSYFLIHSVLTHYSLPQSHQWYTLWKKTKRPEIF